MKCENCGEPCEVVTVDMGIGPYEYWGARGNDVRLAEVSDCCEDNVIEDSSSDKEKSPRNKSS